MVPDKIREHLTVDLFGGERYFLQSDGKSREPRGAYRLDSLLSAAARGTANQVDGKLSDTLRNMLFGVRGLDLAAFNIFRSRELGIATLSTLAHALGTNPDNTLPGDMDAFVALLSEANPAPETQAMGNTARALIAEQFHRILFHEKNAKFMTRGGWKQYFLADEIESATLATVINANSGARVQPDAMFVPGYPKTREQRGERWGRKMSSKEDSPDRNGGKGSRKRDRWVRSKRENIAMEL